MDVMLSKRTKPWKPIVYAGHVRSQNIKFLGTATNAFWQNYWTKANDMVNFFYGDLSTAQSNANALDTKVLNGKSVFY